MRASLTVIAILAVFLLASSCQHANKGESKSGWYISPPGTAAGYGNNPLDNSNAKETAPPPAGSDSSQGEKAPVAPEAPKQQPKTTDDRSSSVSVPQQQALPPSADVDDSAPLETERQENTPAEPPEITITQEPQKSVRQESQTQQRTTIDKKVPTSGPALLLAPPPSAAGYGSPPVGTASQQETPAPPSDNDRTQNGKNAAATVDSAKQEPAKESEKPTSSGTALFLAPPPSAAGYGSVPMETRDEQQTPPAGDATGSGQGKKPAAQEQQATNAGNKSSATWQLKIEPPPSAAGYGK